VNRGSASIARGKKTRSGFTLLEIMVAVSVLGIALAALTSTQFTSVALSRSIRETSAAADAAQAVMEAIRDEDDFKAIYANWSGTAFDVEGLTPVEGDPDGRVGEVVFPGTANKLREDGNDRTLGMPRDIDLDGKIDGADHSGNYRILPMLVRVRWSGARGTQQIQLVGTLAER